MCNVTASAGAVVGAGGTSVFAGAGWGAWVGCSGAGAGVAAGAQAARSIATTTNRENITNLERFIFFSPL
jgi:hypothetical protein